MYGHGAPVDNLYVYNICHGAARSVEMYDFLSIIKPGKDSNENNKHSQRANLHDAYVDEHTTV